MRALLDTNIIISYLLLPESGGNPQAIFQALFDGQFTLLLPEDLLDEIVVTASQKEHLKQRMPVDRLREVVTFLQEIGEPIPRIKDTIPSVSRDPKDDYLLAYAVVGQADYLVSGDKDLLVLKRIEGVVIISPAEFAKLL